MNKDKLVKISTGVAVGGTIFDGIFSYLAVEKWKLGQEVNPILNWATESVESMGASDPFAVVMAIRIAIGLLLLWALYSRYSHQVKRGEETWLTYKALPFCGIVFALLTTYHIVGVTLLQTAN